MKKNSLMHMQVEDSYFRDKGKVTAVACQSTRRFLDNEADQHAGITTPVTPHLLHQSLSLSAHKIYNFTSCK